MIEQDDELRNPDFLNELIYSNVLERTRRDIKRFIKPHQLEQFFADLRKPEKKLKVTKEEV